MQCHFALFVWLRLNNGELVRICISFWPLYCELKVDNSRKTKSEEVSLTNSYKKNHEIFSKK